MKKILIVGISLLSISVANAQSKGDATFQPFKFDVAIGAAIPSGAGSKGGVLFAVEPKYAVMDQLSVGLRLEAALTARGFSSSDGSSASADVKASSSYLATGDYYFNNHTFRPFVGAGVGIFKLAAATLDSDENGGGVSGLGSSTKFGGMVRAGFELGHFRLGVEYNLVGNSSMTMTHLDGTSFTSKSKNSYLGIKAGFFFGGGRNK